MIQTNNNSNKKRLARNTIFLYGRTMIVMLVSLYVSRLILNILGVSDYGIFNAVGGMVGMFAIISNSLIAATQRYISFELGKKDGNPSYVFSLALGLHIFIAIAIIILAETVGIWFLNSHMNLPADRMIAANWVFQFSVLSFVIYLFIIPYSATIVAHECMGVFAFISIFEVLLKLVFAQLLLVAFSDKLIYYSASMAIVPAIGFLLNFLYCKKKFRDNCRFSLVTNKSEYKQIGGFIGWNFIGSTATVLSKQGVSVLLNIFCGVIVNAGRGIALQVDNAINNFIGSFTTAIRPQITKTYAAGDYKDCFNLVNQGTKLVMYLTFLFVVPLSLRTEYVLTLWLKVVPDYAVTFTRLSFLVITMDALSTPLYYLMLATGKIRNYQIAVCTVTLSTFPLTWIALKIGLNPEITYYILFITDIGRWIFQLVFLKKLASFHIINYLKQSMVPILAVLILTLSIGVMVNHLIDDTFWGLLAIVGITTLVLSIIIVTIGLTNSERTSFFNFVLSSVSKR